MRFDFGIQLGVIGFSAAVIGGIDTLVQIWVCDGASYRLVFIFAR